MQNCKRCQKKFIPEPTVIGGDVYCLRHRAALRNGRLDMSVPEGFLKRSSPGEAKRTGQLNVYCTDELERMVKADAHDRRIAPSRMAALILARYYGDEELA